MVNLTIQSQKAQGLIVVLDGRITALTQKFYCKNFDSCTRHKHIKCDDCRVELHNEDIYIFSESETQRGAKRHTSFLCNTCAIETKDYLDNNKRIINKHYSIKKGVA